MIIYIIASAAAYAKNRPKFRQILANTPGGCYTVIVY